MSKKFRLPSVSKVLGEFKDMTSIWEWREQVGPEKADYYLKRGAVRGNVLHDLIQKYLTYKDKSLGISNFLKNTLDLENISEFETIGMNLFLDSYNNGFLDLPKSDIEYENKIELELKPKIGYQGRYDLKYKDKHDKTVLVDIKGSTSMKTKEEEKEFFLQVSSYFMADWKKTGIKPDRCEIWLFTQKDSCKRIILPASQCILYFKEFKSMVVKYYKKKHPEILKNYNESISKKL